MEQTQIRQPKMLAAQSFIQLFGTFLSTFFIFYNSEVNDEQKEGMLNDTFNNVSDMYKKITTSQI